jgi:hypothetical protein
MKERMNKTSVGRLAGGMVVALCISACTALQKDKQDSGLSADAESATVEREKPRLILLTDIGGDPDDEESMVRFLLYSNEFDIEGLIATGRVIRDDRPALLPELITERIEAYGEVRDQLLKHAKGYPSVQSLLDVVKTGYPIPKRKWDAVNKKTINFPLAEKIGPEKDSEGSEWMIKVVDDPDPQPVWVIIWGTASDLAQVLWRVKQERSAEELAAFVSKLRVYAIAKQDLTNDWILENFPDLFILQSNTTTGTFKGIYQEGDQSYYSEEWVNKHVLHNHGPLGKLYSRRPSLFNLPYIEGDTPSFLYLISNGLSDPEYPTWGSWGGQYKGPGPHYLDLDDDAITEKPTGKQAQLSVARWRPAFQNDFQARMDWCVKSFEEANHNPVASFNGNPGIDIIKLTGSAGADIPLSAAGSTDPDGDELSFHWFVYDEAGTYRDSVTIAHSDSMDAILTIPRDARKDQTIHVILEVTDNGDPVLYSYRRVVITVN